MIDVEKLSNYYFSLDTLALLSEESDDLKMNWFFMKNLYMVTQADRITIMTNSIINKNFITPSDHVVIYRPEYYALNVDEIEMDPKYQTVIKTFLLGLLEIYVTSSVPYTDIRMKWCINTLIHYKILTNVFDPVHKTTNTFKELFEA